MRHQLDIFSAYLAQISLVKNIVTYIPFQVKYATIVCIIFWKKVYVELDYQNISLKEIAYKIDIPGSRIKPAIERDTQSFAIDAVCISKALNTSLEYFFDLPENKVSGGGD